MSLGKSSALLNAMMRFNALSVRERGLISAAFLVCSLLAWDTLFLQPLQAKQASLLAVLASADQAALQAAPISENQPASEEETAPPLAAISDVLLERESLQKQLAELNEQLQSAAAELIPPQRTSEVLYAVLQKQHNLSLISLRNQPVRSLVPAASTEGSMPASNVVSAGPYLHPVELVVEGRYLDILAYLRALEALPWKFNWLALELDGSKPLNRARIQLSTLSLDAAWMGT